MFQNRTLLSWPTVAEPGRYASAPSATPEAHAADAPLVAGQPPSLSAPVAASPAHIGQPVARGSAQRLVDFWLSAMFATSERFPGVIRAFQGILCRLAFRASRSVRTGTLANAARILGPGSSSSERYAVARGVLKSFYLFCLDVGRCSGMSRDQLLGEIESVHGIDNWKAARAAGGGLIVITAHMGSFEVGLASLTERESKIHVIFRRDAQGGFERQRSELRRRLNVKEAPIDDGWTMWIGLRDAVASGECVVFQADRVMPGQKGRRVPFLHGHIELPTGPVKLARLTRSPILPTFSVRTAEGKIRLFIEPPILPGEDTAGPGDPMLSRVAAVLEKYVRAYPDQWLMFHPAFCEDAALRPLTPVAPKEDSRA